MDTESDPRIEDDCRSCAAEPDAPCPACNARRRHAVRLVEQHGLSVAATARRLRIPPARVERLLEEHADRQQVEALRRAQIDNAVLRELLDRRRGADPTLTPAELARRLNTSQVQVERWLGLRRTAGKTCADGRRYPARLLERISVEVAGRLVRAMGCAPCEIDGC